MTLGNSFQLMCMAIILFASIPFTVLIFKEAGRRPLFGKESLATGWEMFGFMNIPFVAIPLAFFCSVDVLAAVIALVIYLLLCGWFIAYNKFLNPYNGKSRKEHGYY